MSLIWKLPREHSNSSKCVVLIHRLDGVSRKDHVKDGIKDYAQDRVKQGDASPSKKRRRECSQPNDSSRAKKQLHPRQLGAPLTLVGILYENTNSEMYVKCKCGPRSSRMGTAICRWDRFLAGLS